MIGTTWPLLAVLTATALGDAASRDSGVYPPAEIALHARRLQTIVGTVRIAGDRADSASDLTAGAVPLLAFLFRVDPAQVFATASKRATMERSLGTWEVSYQINVGSSEEASTAAQSVANLESAFDNINLTVMDYTTPTITSGGVSEQLVAPTVAPTTAPTVVPTSEPTQATTLAPTAAPSVAPTDLPTGAPTVAPSVAPTDLPTGVPTVAPSVAPTDLPTGAPTVAPSEAPTEIPTASPTATPTAAPTDTPSTAPTATPTAAPTGTPSAAPTAAPTPAPTDSRTSALTQASTAAPTAVPSATPTKAATTGPTPAPTGNLALTAGLRSVSETEGKGDSGLILIILGASTGFVLVAVCCATVLHRVVRPPRDKMSKDLHLQGAASAPGDDDKSSDDDVPGPAEESEAVDERPTSKHLPEGDRPGRYVVICQTRIGSTSKLCSSAEVGNLQAGEVLDVVEVVQVPEEQRVRGRVQHAGGEGWISLRSTDGVFVWAGMVESGASRSANTSSGGGAPPTRSPVLPEMPEPEHAIQEMQVPPSTP